MSFLKGKVALITGAGRAVLANGKAVRSVTGSQPPMPKKGQTW